MGSIKSLFFAFNPRFPYVNSFLTYCKLRFTTMNSQFTYVNSSFTLVNWVMEYVNHQFMVVNSQFTYVNRQFMVGNSQFPVGNRKFLVGRKLFTYGNRSLFSQFFLSSIKNGQESNIKQLPLQVNSRWRKLSGQIVRDVNRETRLTNYKIIF